MQPRRNASAPAGLLLTVAVVPALEWLAPDVIPFELGTFWTLPAVPAPAFADAALRAAPVMAAGVLLTLIFAPLTRHAQRLLARYGTDRGRVLRITPVTAVVLSASEEVFFRWLLFYAGIAGMTLLDFALLGFAGLHPVRWFFTELAVPVTDFATAFRLHDILTGNPWTVAAAMLASNGRFRDGHAYQGVFGWIWSWFFGMFLFLVVFEHGLPVAIALHTAYNLVILLIHLAIVGTVPRVVLPY